MIIYNDNNKAYNDITRYMYIVHSISKLYSIHGISLFPVFVFAISGFGPDEGPKEIL